MGQWCIEVFGDGVVLWGIWLYLGVFQLLFFVFDIFVFGFEGSLVLIVDKVQFVFFFGEMQVGVVFVEDQVVFCL